MSEVVLQLWMVLTGIATAAATWAVVGQTAGRVNARYASLAPAYTAALSGGDAADSARGPRAWQLWLALAGKDWTLGQLGVVVALYAFVGGIFGGVIGLGLLGLPLGLLVLALQLRRAAARRTRQLAEQLPLALMLLATSLRGGLGLQQALQLVGSEGPPPLANEFARFVEETAMGLRFEEASLRLQQRLGNLEAEMLVSAFLVQRQTGGNLSEILVNLHDTMRDRQTVIGQIRTLTAMGRLSGWILSAIPLVLSVAFYALNREYLMVLVTDPRGQAMAACALVLMVVGVLLIRWIVQVRY